MAKILNVEDQPVNMTLAISLLESAGHSVISATDFSHDGPEGLACDIGEQPHRFVPASPGTRLLASFQHGAVGIAREYLLRTIRKRGRERRAVAVPLRASMRIARRHRGRCDRGTRDAPVPRTARCRPPAPSDTRPSRAARGPHVPRAPLGRLPRTGDTKMT